MLIKQCNLELILTVCARLDRDDNKITADFETENFKQNFSQKVNNLYIPHGCSSSVDYGI
jgi:hypothetical protein